MGLGAGLDNPSKNGGLVGVEIGLGAGLDRGLGV